MKATILISAVTGSRFFQMFPFHARSIFADRMALSVKYLVALYRFPNPVPLVSKRLLHLTGLSEDLKFEHLSLNARVNGGLRLWLVSRAHVL